MQKKYQLPRHKLVILTKCYNAVAEDPEGRYFLHRDAYQASKDYQNHFGLGRAAIFNQVEASLKRLDTPYIDLLQIHRFDDMVPIEETSAQLLSSSPLFLRKFQYRFRSQDFVN